MFIKSFLKFSISVIMSKNKTKSIPKGINNGKLLLVIDWLTLNCEDNFKLLDQTKEYFFQNEIYVQKVDKRTPHFNKMYYLYINQEKIATVVYDSNNKLILDGRCHIKFENHLFYSDNCYSIVEQVVNTFELRSIKISRLDIACDGVNFHKFLTNYEKAKYTNRGVNYFRVNDIGNCRPVNPNFQAIYEHNIDSFTVGSYGSSSDNTSKSYRFARYYNKTKELADKNHKPYIAEYFERNGLTTKCGRNIESENKNYKSGDLGAYDETVYRYEVEIRSAYFAEIQAFEWPEIFDFNFLQALFNTVNKGFFEWRFNDDSNKSRCSPIELFQDFNEPVLSRVKREVLDKLRVIKMSVKRLILDAFTFKVDQTKENQKMVLYHQYMNMAKQLIHQNSLNEWIKYHKEKIIKQLESRLLAEFPKYKVDRINKQGQLILNL